MSRTARPEWHLANRSGFLKAKISLPAVKRMADDHMIQHLDLENSGGFAEPAGQPEISFARAWIA
jgi:hypothetical protein